MQIQSSINTPTGIVNSGFLIKQVSVNNPSTYGVYINFSSATPSISSYDYFIPPNSNYSSPLISTEAISWFCPAFLASVKNPIITVYDDLSVNAVSSPYDFYQFVNFPNFPHTFTPTSSPYDLPNISIQKYQNVFFTLSADIDMSAVDRAAFVLYALTPSGNLMDIGAFSPRGGIVAYSPQAQPEVLDLRLFFSGANIGSSYVFNAFQSELSQEEDYVSLTNVMSASPNSSNTLFNFGVNPPGFIWSVRAINMQSTPQPHNFRIQPNLIHTVGGSVQITSQDVNVSTSLNNRFLIRPKLQLLAAPTVLQITVVNFGTGGNPDQFNIAVKNL